MSDAAPPLPKFVQIEPVGQCNLRCAMCPIQYRHAGPPWGPPALLPFASFCRLVDSFPGMEELHLQGLGEPLMHPAFFRMVEYAARKGIAVSTNTNLTLLTPRRAEQCVSSGLGAMHLSIDGATPGVYERIRRGASFAKVMRNLERLTAARATLGSATPSLRIVTVVMRKNLHELADIVAIAHRHGVKSVFVQHLSHDFGENALPEAYRAMRDFVSSQSLLDEDSGRVDHCFGAARAAAARLGVELRLPSLGASVAAGQPRGCHWPWQGAYITYEGDALPCCMVSTADRFCMGNMLKDGVQAVWSGEHYRALREGLATGRPPAICESCAVYNRTF
jgi:radical SAM protein with 4Fe4S-binding SPASM domain